ncbi:MAG: PAS domain-containing protein [Verrucomicrobiota bacterium]|nr:PAS domain-containing protein [Verrucomicrobiota bacterium]
MTTASTSLPVGETNRQIDHALVSAFLENIPDFVYFKDKESRFIAVSQSKARRHGLAPSDMIGKTDFDLFGTKHAQHAFEDEQDIIRTSEPIVGKLEKITWEDGRETWALTSKLPLRNERGEIIGTFGLTKDVTEAKQMEMALERARKDLMDASRLSGMAEVATGVLHNVGNVLNSLNVSASVIGNALTQLKVESLAKLSALLQEHKADLGNFLTKDSKGQLVPEFLASLARHFTEERGHLLKELSSLQKDIDHIKEIVSMQQAYATTAGVVESHDPVALMEDAIRMNTGALLRHDVRVVREFKTVPHVHVEQAKVLQVLINLIRNAKYALDEGAPADKIIKLGIEPGPDNTVRLIVQDNGVGIPQENLTRIFAHGFTTRNGAGGHGFGLHSSALAAREMHGSLTALSDGIGHGASFILELPVAPPKKA